MSQLTEPPNLLCALQQSTAPADGSSGTADTTGAAQAGTRVPAVAGVAAHQGTAVDPGDLPPAARSGPASLARAAAFTLASAVIAVIGIGLINATSQRTPDLPTQAQPPAVILADVAQHAEAGLEQVEPVSIITRLDADWLSDTSNATGIPPRALAAYAVAASTLAAEQPACGLGWNTLAAIGQIESDHGRHDGAILGDDGYPFPAIRGIALNGNGVAAIPDTDGGAWDGDTRWDRAVGPMQFIPSTWVTWGADGNGDGTANPNQIDDAALAAARYLCAAGTMTTTDGWRTAIFSYNHLDSYVDDVARAANAYAGAVV